MASAGLATIQAIEFFHLAFLSVLQVRLDQKLYVIEGGANLRYFLESPRYSEDIDFDVAGIDRVRLAARIDGVLASRALGVLLQSRDLQIEEVGKPTQTDTTQRWKVALVSRPGNGRIRSRIEFSRRGMDARYRLDPVSPRIVAPYALRPPTLQRYLPDAMIELKIAALAQRAETQARDVFDLDLLFRSAPQALRPGALRPGALTDAVQRAGELDFDAYASQVLPFIDPDVFELHEHPKVWDQMRRHVIDQLLRVQGR